MGAFVGLMCALTSPQPKSWPVHNQQQLPSPSIFPENIPGGCWGLMMPDEASKGSSNTSGWIVKSAKEPHSNVEDGTLQKGCCCLTSLQASSLLPLTVFSGSLWCPKEEDSCECLRWGMRLWVGRDTWHCPGSPSSEKHPTARACAHSWDRSWRCQWSFPQLPLQLWSHHQIPS